MNKKQVRLTESDLKQIVKESVNMILSEAYGTPTNQDKATMWNLNLNPQSKDDALYGYFDSKTRRHISPDEMRKSQYDYNKGEYMPEEIERLLSLMDKIDGTIYGQHDGFEFIDKPLAKLFRKKLWSAYSVGERLIAKAKMNLGQQPDKDYFERH